MTFYSGVGVYRWRRRTLVVGGILFLASLAMLVVAGSTRGFTSDLMLNLGSSLVLAAVSYLIFDPIFDEARKARVQEHARFDETSFIEQMRDTHRDVRILDTWTILLEGRSRLRTFDAMRKALDHGATIRVLLLDPDSAAARQRADELERRQIDVAAQIMENLRQLHLFRAELDDTGRLQVRVYDASPSIQLYQWDGRALISFFPIGKLSFDVPQLEVDMASPWGQFVDRRFDELWEQSDHIHSLERYWSLTVTLTQGDEDLDTVAVPYVGADHEVYVDGTGQLANRLAERVLRGAGVASFGARAAWPPRLSGQLADQPAPDFELIRLEEDAGVLALFDRKYGGYPPDRTGEVFLLRLTPR
ncbi:DUF5919 domain-containing protein [Actinoplanes sp. NPDC051851]|uniref:DUF5919 domain-containing protein n=1 Tax=Actinoplanes sp. NPDC051851 TaxID=3154753 RepID=UPI003440F187